MPTDDGIGIIRVLRRGGSSGVIDIEGWHDPVCRNNLEMVWQAYGLNYLKRHSGPNPTSRCLRPASPSEATSSGRLARYQPIGRG